MFCFCQMFFSRAEFGLSNDLGYEEERRWGPWTHIVMCPQACGDAVEAFQRLNDLRATLNLQYSSTLFLNIMQEFVFLLLTDFSAFQVVSFWISLDCPHVYGEVFSGKPFILFGFS